MKCCVAVSMHVLLISCHENRQCMSPVCGLVIKRFRYILLFLLQQNLATAIFTQVAKLNRRQAFSNTLAGSAQCNYLLAKLCSPVRQ